MSRYIHQLTNWPNFYWDKEKLATLLTEIRHQQGRLLGRMEALGFDLQSEATLQTLTMDVLKSSEIEGEMLDTQQVRSSIARRLGMNIDHLVPADRNVEGVVEMMLDATQNYQQPLSEERLFGWQNAMLPTGRSGMYKITVGAWRNNTIDDPMQVVSGPMGRGIVHFEAPAAEVLAEEMNRFFDWFNKKQSIDPVLKAAIAHIWFVTVHPFDDGNGRIARAITDMQLARADATAQRFYSMSTQVQKERKKYYEILEETQKGHLDITAWLEWFLNCLGRAIAATANTLSGVLTKARFWETNTHTVLNERQKKMLNKMLDGFDGKLTTSKWAKLAKCSQDTALRDILDLIEKNILAKDVGGGRSTGYALVGG